MHSKVIMSTKKSLINEQNKILGRIKSLLSLKRDHEVADLFGIMPNDLSNRKSRGTVKKIAVEWAEKEKINLDWLIYGRGNPYKDNYYQSVKESKPEFSLHGEWQAPNLPERSGFDSGHEFWRAFKLLHEIYESGEEIYIRAIFQNLLAFNNGIKLKQETQENKERIDEIENIVKHLDRRSGQDRRTVMHPNFIGQKNRREKIDRRKTKI